MENLLIMQSGGPTAAINATLAGILEMSFLSGRIGKIYGALGGITGVLDGHFRDLNQLAAAPGALDSLSRTPSAALGSCRFKLGRPQENEDIYVKILSVLKQNQIRFVLCIGGNDSMDTVACLDSYFQQAGAQITVMGVPKTIDNDLEETDHTPGYGSAAKYVATTFIELRHDVEVYSVPSVTLVEVMGRDAGWLTAASALASVYGKGPDMLYLCEKELDTQIFIEDVENTLKQHFPLLIAVSEGLRDTQGNYLSSSTTAAKMDAFGHPMLAGVGQVLEQLVREKIGCKVRSLALGLMQRCAGHLASRTDLQEARMLGAKAMIGALDGRSGEMPVIRRVSQDPYGIALDFVPAWKVAGKVKKVPLEWISSSGNGVTPDMISYLRPLIQGEMEVSYHQGLPEYFRGI